MNVNLYHHELGYRIVADDKFGRKCELISQPGDGIYEYVRQTGRLNVTYIVYWLTNPPKDFRPLSKERQEFLDFLNHIDEVVRPRRIRKPGWQAKAGLSTGEEPHHVTRKPGDVTVHGDCARATLKISE